MRCAWPTTNWRRASIVREALLHELEEAASRIGGVLPRFQACYGSLVPCGQVQVHLRVRTAQVRRDRCDRLHSGGLGRANAHDARELPLVTLDEFSLYAVYQRDCLGSAAAELQPLGRELHTVALACSPCLARASQTTATFTAKVHVFQEYKVPVSGLQNAFEYVIEPSEAGAFEAGALEVTTLAAYDINLQTDGEEYQPDDEHPLAVTITTDALEGALSSGKDVQVWHIADEGSVEVIKDFQLSDGAITFEATGFSTYLLVARGEKSESEVPLSSRFGIRATAKTYERATTVTFVDVDKNPIKGTVTGTLNIAYTGNGPESNATNTIDLYEFIDKLDPAIADEYDFSRVFVQLTETDQKDFRFIQVGDDTAIGGTDTSKYRVYFYMDSIAQNASGQDYDGTWYLLSNGGNIDNVYIEYYHVFPASFYALDTRNDPVAGAKFALYTDPECSIPFEYQHKEITATSDMNGLVSFGKVPQGTYYMKETVFPEGYKKSTNTYTVVVDGETTIDNVVHDDDDGYVLTQTKVPSYGVLAETDTDDAVTVSATDGDSFVVALSNLNGTSSEPARVTITNVFSKSGAPATGIDDNAAVWGAIVAACGVLISLLLFRHHARL